MVRIYPRTREREKAWRLTSYGTLGSLLTSPLLTLIVKGKSQFGLVEVLYTFSLALESVCILPQLLLLRQTTVPTVITSFYLVTLGSYRFFYILNWIVRAVGPERHFDPINFIFGVVQTALYLDFAWVYWTRQRVKLRGGGVVDSDDLRKSWIVGRVLGGGRAGARSVDQAGEDEDFDDVEGQTGIIPNGNAARKSTIPSNRWGKRGVSVSADDTLEDHEHIRKNRQQHLDNKKTIEGGTPQERAGMLKQPDEFLDEDDDDDRASPFAVGDGDSSPILTPKTAAGGQQQAVLNSGQEWGDGQSEVTQNV